MWAAGPAAVGLAQVVEGPVHTWGRSTHATRSHLDWWLGEPITGGELKMSCCRAGQTRDHATTDRINLSRDCSHAKLVACEA